MFFLSGYFLTRRWDFSLGSVSVLCRQCIGSVSVNGAPSRPARRPLGIVNIENRRGAVLIPIRYEPRADKPRRANGLGLSVVFSVGDFPAERPRLGRDYRRSNIANPL